MGQGCCSSRIRWPYRHLPPFFLFGYYTNGGGTATDKRSEGHNYGSSRHVCLQAFRCLPNRANPRPALLHVSHGRQAAHVPECGRLSGRWNPGGNCTPRYPIATVRTGVLSVSFLDALVVRRQPLSRASMNGKIVLARKCNFFWALMT